MQPQKDYVAGLLLSICTLSYQHKGLWLCVRGLIKAMSDHRQQVRMLAIGGNDNAATMYDCCGMAVSAERERERSKPGFLLPCGCWWTNEDGDAGICSHSPRSTTANKSRVCGVIRHGGSSLQSDQDAARLTRA